jgi:enoyl-CoA hydratase
LDLPPARPEKARGGSNGRRLAPLGRKQATEALTVDYENLLYETNERVATITLNRPEKLNALSLALQNELVGALEAAEADRAVRVIVIKGAGRAFCAGYDLSGGVTGPEASGPPSAVDDAAGLEETLRRLLTIWHLRKPVIAQVHGFCLAGGTQLALICDITVAAEDATFGIPQLPVGIGFVLPFWTWLIGPKKAREVFYRIGSRVTAVEAERMGMVNAIVPAAALEERVRTLAAGIAETPAEILLLAKRGINETQEVQGFLQSLQVGVGIDALSHQSRAVRAVNRLIREEGLRTALANWREVV